MRDRSRLSICLWDFSWYTMSGSNEPFADLDRCFRDAKARGYNCVRICAMPLLLFGSGQADNSLLTIASLGSVGKRTRWYTIQGNTEILGIDRLGHLLTLAQKHQFLVILSSWEFQQSTTFLADRDRASSVDTIPPSLRIEKLTDAWILLLNWIIDQGYERQIAFIELHNEVEFSRLADHAVDHGISFQDSEGILRFLKPQLTQALDMLQGKFPDLLFTASFVLITPYPKDVWPDNLQVLQAHLYIRGVLQEMMDRLDVEGDAPFPNNFAKSLLRTDAPCFQSYSAEPELGGRLAGNPVGLRLLYLHDWCDPVLWDRFLYENYGRHAISMNQKMDERLAEIVSWAKNHQVPVVIGEGYVGYTPLLSQFEEGPIGKALVERAVLTGIRNAFWGMVLCSNAAPHHPFWADLSWQLTWNRRFQEGIGGTIEPSWKC